MVAAPQAQTKRQFVMITPEELKLNYKAGVLNAQTYLLYLIKTQRTEGWEWRFNVEEFCRKWEIAERTFYDALSKLRVKKLISWRTGDSTVVVSWGREATKTPNLHSSDSPNSPNPDTVIAPQDVAEAPQNVAEALQDVANPLQDVAEEQHSNPCTANVPDSLQIYTNKKEIHTDNNVCGNKISEEEEELPQAANEQNLTKEESAETPLTAKERQDSGVPNENPGFDQSSAAVKTRLNTYNPKWECPVPEKYREFLQWRADSLLKSGSCQAAESLTMARNWANKNPEDATEMFHTWASGRVVRIAGLSGKYAEHDKDWNKTLFKNFVLHANALSFDEAIAKFEEHYNNGSSDATKQWLKWISRNLDEDLDWLTNNSSPEVYSQIIKFAE